MGLLAALVAGPPSAVVRPAPAVAQAPPRLAFVQVPADAAEPCNQTIADTILADRYRTGSRLILADLSDIASTRRELSTGFACATDPVFSHDGTRLAFAGLRNGDRFLQIWELVGDDSEPRQVVSCDADCITPAYLPNGRIVFASSLAAEYEEHGGKLSFTLYDVGPGEETPTRITFNPSSEFEPVVLPDGRLLHISWQHVGNRHWPTGMLALMLVNSDGTGVFPLTGSDRPPWFKRSPALFGADGVAFVASDEYQAFGSGALLSSSLNDPFGPYSELAPASQALVADAAGTPEGTLLAAAKPSAGGSGTFGLYRLAGADLELLFDEPAYHELNPAIGVPGPRPMIRISTVVPDTSFGYLLALNCYQTDRADSARKGLKPGAVQRVRVLEGLPLKTRELDKTAFVTVPGRQDEPMVWPGSATGSIPVRILGEVPPAADGSFYVKVPADRPLRLQLIDRDGFAIVNQRAWFWVRPNERRACIGCHEDRELAPANATPLAAGRRPTDLTDPAGWQTVSFRSDIQPILNSTCAVSDCHRPPTPTAGLNMTADVFNEDRDAVMADLFGPAYANLLARQENKPFSVGGRRVHPGDARSSPMLWMLYGRALAPQYKPAPFERPLVSAHPGPMLPESKLDLIRKWIDLGAPYDSGSMGGQWAYRNAAPAAPGGDDE